MPRLVPKLALLLTLTPLAADDLASRLPPAAKQAADRHEAALAEARKAHDAAIAKANKALADELTQLQVDATKAGKLDDALLLRDALTGAKLGEPIIGKTLVFEVNNEKGKTLTIATNRGFRWSDWNANQWGILRPSLFGAACYHPNSKTAKPWGYLVVTVDRSEACWWVPGEPAVFLRPVK